MIGRSLLIVSCLAASIACGDSTSPASQEVATVDVALVHNEIEIGQHDTATAVARNQSGGAVDAGSVTWSSTFPEVAVVSPTTGEILAIASGTTQISANVAGKVGRRTVIVSPPPILINEVFPNGDVPKQ
jgi:uncharacterized protein YjdB